MLIDDFEWEILIYFLLPQSEGCLRIAAQISAKSKHLRCSLLKFLNGRKYVLLINMNNFSSEKLFQLGKRLNTFLIFIFVLCHKMRG